MKYILFFFIFLFLFSACKKKEGLSVPPGTLIKAEKIQVIKAARCVQLVDSADISSFAQYNVQLVKIIYATDYQGKTIKTSGMLFLPVGKDTVELVTYCHGTIVPIDLFGMDKQTPSLFSGQSSDYIEERNIGLAWSTAGYTVFMPDYIGYGITKKKEHPYVYYPELVKSIYHGDLAVQEYFQDLPVYEDNKMFLAGYSQGAGASLFTHRYYETKHPGQFDIVASLNLSGPYNFKKFITSVFNAKNKKNDHLGIYCWALYSINKFSQLKRPNDHYFAYPVYDQTSAFLPPSKIPAKALNAFFIQQIVDNKDPKMTAVLERNSIMGNWIPKGEVFLYHGDQDLFVPYFNSKDCYQHLLGLGADVHLKTYHGGTHTNVLSQFILSAKHQMDLLK